MSEFNLEQLVRENIRNLKPYTSARHIYIGEGKTLLDANENPYGDGVINRYPDPMLSDLRLKISERESVDPDQIIFGNGSDEILDLVIRIFCEPARDSIVICPPTFGMYKVSADINNVEVKTVPLLDNFQLDTEAVLAEDAKVLFLCSPNSPTGNLMNTSDIEHLLQQWSGVVVIDEAYIEFADVESWVTRLQEYPNLIVTRTFSKFWGLAGCRIGYSIASTAITALFSAVKPPYNVDNLASQAALQALSEEKEKKDQAAKQLEQREILEKTLLSLPYVKQVHPSDTNFLYVSLHEDAVALYEHCKRNNAIIRRYGKDPYTMRLSVGTAEEMAHFVEVLSAYAS